MNFAGFQLRGLLRRSDDREPPGAILINHPRNQRSLRSDHRQVSIDFEIRRDLRSSRISRPTENLVTLKSKSPRNRMLTPATTDNKNPQSCHFNAI